MVTRSWTSRDTASIVRIVASAAVVLALGFVLRHSVVDEPLARFFNGFHEGLIATATDFLYWAFKASRAAVITLVAAATVWGVRRDWRPAVRFAVTIGLTWLPVMVIKVLIGRPRPDPALLPHPYLPTPLDLSFPSGHTTFAMAFACAIVVALGRTRWRVLALLVAVIVAVAVPLSVLVATVHYPTDVVGSLIWVFGAAPAISRLFAPITSSVGPAGPATPDADPAPGYAGVPKR